MSSRTISVGRDVLAGARRDAAELRAEWTRRGIFAVNLMSSPGAGKTSLLEATAEFWNGRRRMAVLVGDLATDRDAQRFAPFTPVVQLTTGGACHLELPLVRRGLEQLGELDCEFLFIENVGNLVCPASHDLGEHLRVIVLSTTEGDDKPGKYPKAFRTSQVLVVNKVDLLPYVPFSVEAAITDARLIQPAIQAVAISAQDRTGIAEWCALLETLRNQLVTKGNDPDRCQF
ncbi:MAG TPA: hydrogenase nickel incorporation protein HypB [Planctomycetaceae bacterium]|nr:hydrogenase nickel incorporation protein HypB [Planctomycetaceae bacterium]